MKRFAIVLLWVGIIVVGAFPPDFVRRWERALGATLVEQGHHDAALRIYWWLALRNDTIGRNNWHVVDVYLASNKSKEARKTAKKAARQAWKYFGEQGLGAAYWNLAMHNVRYGRENEKHDAAATRYLEQAQQHGIPEAILVQNAGPGTYDRMAALTKLGDSGAALAFGMRMHFANDTQAKDAALLIAALSGDPNAMYDLAVSLRNRRDANIPLYNYWMMNAAEAGGILAMARVGYCYQRGSDLCGEIDLAKSEMWLSRTATSDFVRSYPKIWTDPGNVLRIGMAPRYYSPNEPTREAAQRAVQRLRARN